MANHMNERSSANDAEWVNEALRDYEGFADILSMLQHSAGALGDQPASQQLPMARIYAVVERTPDEERATQEAAFNAFIARSEIAELVQRIQEFDEEQASRALSVLFASLGTENSSEE